MPRLYVEGFLPFFENKACGYHDEEKPHGVVPLDVLLQVGNRKHRKHNQGNDFLDGLQLGGIKDVTAIAVGGDLETVFKEGDAPAYQRDLPKRDILVSQVTVPGEGHENVREQEQNNGEH
jgi:hypothetical protein